MSETVDYDIKVELLFTLGTLSDDREFSTMEYTGKEDRKESESNFGTNLIPNRQGNGRTDKVQWKSKVVT